MRGGTGTRLSRTVRCAVACSLSAAAAASAEPVTYRLDPAHSAVHFEVLHFGTSTSRGRFAAITGVVTLDRTQHAGDIGLRIDTARVSTGLPVFDARLREPDLLSSAEYPDAWFVARDFRFDGDALREVRGELTLRGVSRGLTLKALRFDCRATTSPDGERCGGDFDAHLLRSDYGMSYGLPLVGDDIHLHVEVEAVREAATAH